MGHLEVKDPDDSLQRRYTYCQENATTKLIYIKNMLQELYCLNVDN